jgi:hypothetical protein
MTASALISGRIYRDPERKVSKAGKPFVVAKLREGAGDAAVWWSIIAFADEVREDLLGLKDGDAAAVNGPFTVTTFERHGEIRLSHSIVAERLITARHSKKGQREDTGVPLHEGAR